MHRKHGKPKTTPEHGCISPSKKKVQRGSRLRDSRLTTLDVVFDPVAIGRGGPAGPSPTLPSPLSVLAPPDIIENAADADSAAVVSTTAQPPMPTPLLHVVVAKKATKP